MREPPIRLSPAGRRRRARADEPNGASGTGTMPGSMNRIHESTIGPVTGQPHRRSATRPGRRRRDRRDGGRTTSATGSTTARRHPQPARPPARRIGDRRNDRAAASATRLRRGRCGLGQRLRPDPAGSGVAVAVAPRITVTEASPGSAPSAASTLAAPARAAARSAPMRRAGLSSNPQSAGLYATAPRRSGEWRGGTESFPGNRRARVLYLWLCIAHHPWQPNVGHRCARRRAANAMVDLTVRKS